MNTINQHQLIMRLGLTLGAAGDAISESQFPQTYAEIRDVEKLYKLYIRQRSESCDDEFQGPL